MSAKGQRSVERGGETRARAGKLVVILPLVMLFVWRDVNWIVQNGRVAALLRGVNDDLDKTDEWLARRKILRKWKLCDIANCNI